jgi:branched-chain amino acid transport system permease protein
MNQTQTQLAANSSAFTVRRWSRASAIGTSTFAVVVVILAALPYMVNLSLIYSMVDLFILLILAMTWNMLAGYGGMVSVGQQAFIGVGAYSIVVLADHLGLNLFAAIALSAVICGLLAIPISFLVFRLAGGYFAVGTWVISEVVRLTVVQVPEVGGGAGASFGAMSGLSKELRIATSYWIALGAVVLVLAACVLLIRSRGGLALTAVRDDVTAASTSGVMVTAIKRLVFVFAGAGAGIAGALIAISSLRVQPDSVFSVQWSAFMIFIVVVGGVGTLEGPIFGVLVFWVLKQTLADYGPLYLICLGAIGIAFVLFVRGGIWGLVSRKSRIELFPVGYRFDSKQKIEG